MATPQKSIIMGLTVWQPWNWCFTLTKRVENRTWEPPAYMIGNYVALHMGKTYDQEGADWLRKVIGYPVPPPSDLDPHFFAIAKLVGVRTGEPEPLGATPEENLGRDFWYRGPYGFQFRNFVFIEPVFCRGNRKFWVIPNDKKAELRQAYAKGERRF
jgi:hypothetical protein